MPKGAHFYTAFPEECAAVKANPRWIHEGVALRARLPDADGRCSAGTMPIHRAYNRGQGGVPVHKFSP